MRVQRLFEALGFHHIGVNRAAVIKGVDVLSRPVRVDVHQQVHAALLGHVVAKIVHGLELPPRIYMHQRKWRRAWEKSLAGKVQHHGAVLTDAIKHDRVLRLCHHLAHDVNALGLKAIQMR